MKILHTSDWHLGHTLYSYDRTTEQTSFLKQLTDIVKEERPDAMIVSGDIYHTSSPSTSIQKLYTDAMLEIHNTNPGMTIVVTAGNHDSSSRLEISRSLWGTLGLHVIGSIEKDKDQIDFDKHIVEIKGEDGELKGYVIAVPHIYHNNYPAINEGEDSYARMKTFFGKLQEIVAQRNTKRLPVIMMAHLAITGTDIKGHEEMIGGIDYYDLDQIGHGYDYLALGHIHHPQDVKGSNGKARYCGSPLPVSFDETYAHSVTIIDFKDNNEFDKKTIEIENPYKCLTIPQKPKDAQEVLKEFNNATGIENCYIRLNVLVKDYLPADFNEKALDIAQTKNCKYCYPKITRDAQNENKAAKTLTIQDIKEISPLATAITFYEEYFGIEMDEELKEMLENVIEETKREEQLKN